MDEFAPTAHDGKRFVELLGSHERQIFRYIYSLTANWDDAEEVMQRVRIRLWEQFCHYDEGKSFAGWARAIAYYLVLAYRKEKNRRIFSESALLQLSQTYESSLADIDQRHEAMLECLAKLPPENRQLALEYYSDLGGVDKIAKKAGITIAALRQQLYRIRKKLNHCIQLAIGSMP